MTDVAELRRLIDANPWMTLVSDDRRRARRVALRGALDEDRDDLTIVGHVGRPDDLIHGLGERELLVVVQGPHGYISPGWYGDGAIVPTWNFVSAHLSGIPELLTPDENLRVLDRLVARFESGMPQPRLMWELPERRRLRRRELERGTVGFRLTPDAGRRQAQAQPEPGRRCRRDDHRRARRGDGPVREPAARGRDAARARRAEGARVTAVAAPRSDVIGERPAHRAPSARIRSTTAPSTCILANGVIADIAPAGALRADAASPRRRRRLAGPGTVGPPRPRRAVGARRAARAARHAESAAEAARIMAQAHRPAPTAGGSAPGSATRCGPTAPTLAVLDAATGDVPTYLINADVHSVWLNTAALRREGTNPTASASCARQPAFEISRRLNAVDAGGRRPARRRRWRGMPRRAVSSGSSISTWRGTRRPGRAGSTAGFDTLRVEFGIYPAVPRPGDRRGAAHRRPRARRGIRPRARRLAQGHHRRVARHAHRGVLARVPGRPAQPRVLDVDPATLVELMTRGDRGGLSCGDPRDRRHRELPRARRVRRRPARGARSSTRSSSRTPTSRVSRVWVSARACSPSTRSTTATSTDSIWAGQTAQPYPLRALADTGANLLFGSDAPVSPLDPWAAIAAAVFRTRDGREPGSPQQGVDAATALAASTHGGSTAAARIEPGAAPTSALCERDPLTASEAELRSDGRRGDASRRSC